MNFQKVLVPLLCLVLLGAAWRSYGWQGVAVVSGGLVMWLLLHYTRLITILKKAANRPIGFVGSAVMLNAKLKPGVTLMHVVAMTHSLGAQQSPRDEQPELFRWTDGTDSHVTCEFRGGKLVSWKLFRPSQTETAVESPVQTPPAP
jgi:hypothetical protein